MQYHTIWKAQVSNSRAIMALVFHSVFKGLNQQTCKIMGLFGKKLFWFLVQMILLAHLNMKCSEWAIEILLCPSSVVQCPVPVINFLPCVCSRGNIFSPKLMELGQNDEFKTRSSGVEN